MSDNHFWYIDDENGVRWAVRVSDAPGGTDPRLDAPATVVFTSLERQIATDFPFDKAEHELTSYEVLELLGQAKREMVGGVGRDAALAA